jgi:hypothetical protein
MATYYYAANHSSDTRLHAISPTHFRRVPDSAKLALSASVCLLSRHDVALISVCVCCHFHVSCFLLLLLCLSQSSWPTKQFDVGVRTCAARATVVVLVRIVSLPHICVLLTSAALLIRCAGRQDCDFQGLHCACCTHVG